VGAVLIVSPPVAAIVVDLLSWAAEVLSPSVTAVVTAVLVLVVLEVVGAVLLLLPFFFPLLMR
jgi:hypothetical protein